MCIEYFNHTIVHMVAMYNIMCIVIFVQVVYQSRYLRYYINRAKIYPCKSELDGPEVRMPLCALLEVFVYFIRIFYMVNIVELCNPNNHVGQLLVHHTS